MAYSWELRSWVLFVTTLGPPVRGALQCTPDMLSEVGRLTSSGLSRRAALGEVFGVDVSGDRGP